MATDATTAQRWILLPGTLCTSSVFAPLMEALGVAPDRQAVMVVDVPEIEACCQKLAKVVRPGDIVCGFSLGAIVAAHCADALPATCALVLIALNPRPDDPEKRANREALRAAAHSGALEGVLRTAAPVLFAQPTPDLLATVIDMAKHEAHHIDAQTALAINRPGALPALRKTSVPVILVTGTNDRQAPPDLAVEAAAVARLATALQTPGLGHFCLLEDPVAVAGAIRDGFEALGVEGC